MRLTLLALPILLSIYTSPTLNKNNEQVTVHEVTLSSLPSINSSAYKPKSIPAALGNIGLGSRSAVGRSVVPSAVETLPSRPGPIATKAPPRISASPYKIGVSDVLLLATPTPTPQEALSGLAAAKDKRQGYTVQDDGAIAVPDVGRILVAGMSLKDAENAVFNALVDRQIDPKFSIEVAEFNSQQVSVAGSVNKPLLAPISIKPLKLQDAIQLAGGLTPNSTDDTVIRINRGDQEYQIPLKALRARPSLQRLILADGDTVFVDQDYKIEQARAYNNEKLALAALELNVANQRISAANLQLAAASNARQNFLTKVELGAIKRDYVFLAGEVAQQGRFAMPFDNQSSLADALYSAQGISTETGDPGEIYLLRLNDAATHIDAYHIDGSDAVNLLLTTRMELRPNDMIFVSEQRVTAWNRVVSKLVPSFGIANQVR